ncbi:hypothetical protein AB0I30_07520 [Nocardia tengchongensis]|uniref:hypothetical protein n=1 Tax=Nocardia tengchongensis TaxID=2055889 RepID=UPI0033C22DC8
MEGLLEGDVVEVGVGVLRCPAGAADGREQGGVEDDAAVGLVQAQPGRDGVGDQADRKALLERHSGGQVGGEGQGREHLGDPDGCHGQTLIGCMHRCRVFI